MRPRRHTVQQCFQHIIRQTDRDDERHEQPRGLEIERICEHRRQQRLGPAIVLKVMAGDTISLSVWSWYSGPAQAPATGTGIGPIFNDLFPLLTAGVTAAGGNKGGAIPASTSSPLLTTDLANLIKSDSLQYLANQSRPKAFLNWMVVDEEFAAVSSPNHVAGIQVPGFNAGDTMKQMVGLNGLVVRRNGWIYVYVSNESNQNVYFDNLVVNLKHGPLVEQKDYYAFGMEIPGLSTKMIKYKYDENRLRYNNIEFDTAFGLNEYEAFYRELDPAIGRWNQIDPKPTQDQSTYSSMNNNPLNFKDPLGDTLAFPGASSEFVAQFYDAYANLDAHGVGDNIANLQSATQIINIVQLTSDDKMPSNFSPETKTINWDPLAGTGVDNGITISPATTLDHEVDHALEFLNHPDNFANNSDPKLGRDKKYTNKEERRVITGREQKVARALREIGPRQITRSNHNGHVVPVSSPNSTQSTNEIEIQRKLKEMQQQKKQQEKNIYCIGCDGPCCKPNQ